MAVDYHALLRKTPPRSENLVLAFQVLATAFEADPVGILGHASEVAKEANNDYLKCVPRIRHIFYVTLCPDIAQSRRCGVRYLLSSSV